MAIFALQYLAGGFLDEDLQHFNKKFDDWCVSFDNYEDALTLAKTLPNFENIDIVEITPLSYPKYFSLSFKVLFMQQDKLKIILFV